MTEERKQLEIALDFLHLQLPASIAEDVKKIAYAALEAEAIAFVNWGFADDVNPFMWHDKNQRFIQACGNSTSWSTKELYDEFSKPENLKL